MGDEADADWEAGLIEAGIADINRHHAQMLLKAGEKFRPKCMHCHGTTVPVKGSEIYPHMPRLHQKNYWLCDCGAYVGCHGDTLRPLGRPANAKLRKVRSDLHGMMDQLWKQGYITRETLYLELSQHLAISLQDTHVALFSLKECDSAFAWVKRKLKAFGAYK